MNLELRSESSESDEVASARAMLRAWFEGKNSASVHFRENLHPELDPDAGYALAYEGISEKELVSMLDLPGGGQIALRVVAVPLLGVLSTKVSVPSGTRTRIGLDCPHWHRLHERGSTLPRPGQIVEYEPW